MNKFNVKELRNPEDFDIFCEFMSGFNTEFKDLLCHCPDQNEWLIHTFNDPDFQDDLFLAAFDGDQLVGVALGIIRKWNKPDKGFVKFIYSSSYSEKFSVISTLLSSLENRLFYKGVTEIVFGSSSPFYLFPGLHVGDKEILKLLLSLGWNDVSERINRVIDTNNLLITESDLKKKLNKHDNNISISIASASDKDEALRFIENEFSESWKKQVSKVFLSDNYGFCSIIRDNQN